jgi:hypothetical protein
MVRAACGLGLVLLAASIAAPAGAGTAYGSAGPRFTPNRSNGQTIPFSSVAPEVVVPPGEQDDSAGDPNGGPDADRGGEPPDDGPPIDQSAGRNNQAIPA